MADHSAIHAKKKLRPWSRLAGACLGGLVWTAVYVGLRLAQSRDFLQWNAGTLWVDYILAVALATISTFLIKDKKLLALLILGIISLGLIHLPVPSPQFAKGLRDFGYMIVGPMTIGGVVAVWIANRLDQN
ncbi:MAG: hypothetical protein Fur0036_06990 [Fimbriimonadaceae bacterium]